MRPNKIIDAWNEGRSAVNIFLSTPGSFTAEVMASLGWDAVTVDMQHGVIDYSNLIPMFQGITQYDPAPMVRVPWNDPAIIMKSLDAGAYGVICPMINSMEECERFVGACRYAPRGYRSTGPIRAVFYSGADYHEHADETVLTLAMIETQESVDNLDSICSVRGLDAVYIGPSDLSVSIGGGPGGDQRAPEVMERIDLILEVAHSHGIKAGIHSMSSDYANEMVAKGFDLVTLSSDFRHMMASAQGMLSATNLTRD
ncbi:MAG: 2,4-dihydroxyhept-2-ene-1,7-dioic acid aldolase [Pelagibacteraceae bacterium]|nr:2,4-dihydroxyhept-2-ene-1,7-dioic acid aldolase [Pelagibacteraceae bacterium]PPR10088.1 MAG: 5-keto-4-deoxy-D-glucarate aldolase [Alphaproteobacteria bacterium MarineAlpha11_Bin1]|tara:strand:+ start:977 stop:1744 length:768 start_codon:yes stop_codon:yes gene_type:complete